MSDTYSGICSLCFLDGDLACGQEIPVCPNCLEKVSAKTIETFKKQIEYQKRFDLMVEQAISKAKGE